jgi:hypothetical protein
MYDKSYLNFIFSSKMTKINNVFSKEYTELEKLGYGDFLLPPVEFDYDEVEYEDEDGCWIDDENSDDLYDHHLGDDE